MTKAVLEAESEGDARRTAAAVPSPALPNGRRNCVAIAGTREGESGCAFRPGSRTIRRPECIRVMTGSSIRVREL